MSKHGLEWLTLAAFGAVLLFCIMLNIPLIVAMLAGLVIFWLYGLRRGFSFGEMLQMSWQGVSTIKGILVVFLLIGMLTGLWRAAGTIPVIICYATDFIMPETFIMMAFILNCAVSVLMGTSFGTVATMGVIAMTIANTMNVDPVWTGGAILSGIYFGDRWSAVSTSALLVATVTDTDLYSNLRHMLKTAFVPFLISCGIYLWAGWGSGAAETELNVWQLFSSGFNLHIICILPAVVILLLAALRIKVKLAMAASIITAFFTAFFVQNESIESLLSIMAVGFVPHDAKLVNMLSGGGIISMLNTTAIVCVASCYAGIFEKTPLLTSIDNIIERARHSFKPFFITAVTATAASAIACNQTLAIMLTNQLCKKLYSDKDELAVVLEDTAVVISPLIPWCIAGAVPLAIIGASFGSFLTAVFLYILPVFHCIKDGIKVHNA